MRHNSLVAARMLSPFFVAAIAGFVLLLSGNAHPPQAAAGGRHVPLHVRQRALSDGRVRVIVELARHEDVARVLSLLPAGSRTLRQFQRLPFVALDLTSSGLDALDALGGDVVRVMEDTIHKPLLAESVPLIQAEQVWASGYDGTGMTIAILDTGVDGSHPFLAGKVAAEACFSSTQPGITQSFCPNGANQQIGPGAAVPCSLPDCIHGTHVAGIAAGHDSTGAHPASGVAPGAQIIAVQVFTRITNSQVCGGTAPCVGGFTSDIVGGLEYVYSLASAGTYNVAAVNMSLGGGLFEAACDNTPYKPSIDRLRAIGIATVVAAGNDGRPTGLAAPACVSSAVSVGATTKTDGVAWFSNVAPFLSLFAPGDAITSSVPGGGYQAFRGTSMAAPHVAGVWGLMRQIAPTLSVGTILSVLRQTGLPITDTRFPTLGDGTTVPRVRAFDAFTALIPATADPPAITSLSPASARAGFGGITLTVFGAGFVPRTIVEFNGVARPTTVVNNGELRASIPGSDITAVGTAFVRATTSAPGGGTSAALPFTITPPPSLIVSAPIVAPGSSATVTLIDGAGGSTDWLALAAVGAPDNSYLSWTYVGQGVTTRTWTATMPTAPGAYEFRLFVNGNRVSTSPPVTVDPTFKPVPVVNSVSPTSVIAGGPGFTLTVFGNSFVSASVVRWNGADRPTTFLNATALQASISAADIASAGSALVSVSTPSPGGGVSPTFAVTINPAPVLTVSATSIAAGASVTVTLTNGRGAPQDWLTVAPVNASDSTYVQWTYVGAGATTRSWTVTLMSAGSYQFRLFLDNGYTRAAKSPTVVVIAGPPTLLVDTTSTTSGSNITATLLNGAGGGSDWLAFAPTSAANNSYLTFVYLGAGVTTRTWTLAAPSPGTYEFRLFLNNGFTRAATSPPITVVAGVPSLTSLSPAAAPIAGAAFSLTVNGSGFTAGSVVRWNGLDRATTYVAPTQLTASIPAADLVARTTAGVTVFTPAPGGGLSPALAFEVSPPPTLAVDVATAMAGTQATLTLTGGFGGATDWLALAQTSAPNSSYVTWVYVGAGVTTRAWTVTLPPAAGTYEFRLFMNGGYTRLATSPSIVVTPAPNPVPVVTSLSPLRAIVGAPITLTVNGSGFASSSTIRWNNIDRPTTFLSGTQLRTALSASDVATIGSAQVSVASPAPGGGLSASVPFEIASPPVLTVSTATAAPGSTVTVTLTGGAGGPTDWLTIAASGAANTSYLSWTYVGDGITTRTWTVTMPNIPGTYEIRLFLNNGYVRVATSPPITVS